MRKLLLISAIFIFILSGCGGNGQISQNTPENTAVSSLSLDDYGNTIERIHSKYDELIGQSQDEMWVREALMDWINDNRKSLLLTTVGFDENRLMLLLDYIDGVEGVFMFYDPYIQGFMETGVVDENIINRQLQKIFTSKDGDYVSIKNNKAVIYNILMTDPNFSGDSYYINAVNGIVDLLKYYGFEVDKKDGIIDPFSFKSAPDYSVIIILSHGFYSGNNNPGFVTGYKVKDIPIPERARYQDALKNKELGIWGDIIEPEAAFALKSKFLYASCGNFENHSIILLGSCSQMVNFKHPEWGARNYYQRLADEKGLGAVLGWDDVTAAGENWSWNVLNQMSGKQNSHIEAYDYCIEKGMDKCDFVCEGRYIHAALRCWPESPELIFTNTSVVLNNK